MAEPQMTMEQQDAWASQIIRANAKFSSQRSATITQITNPYIPGQATTINVPVNPVGLLTAFGIRVRMNVQQTGAETHTRQPLGASALFSQINFTDGDNTMRHSCTSWHLHQVATARYQAVNGAAYTTDTPTGIGNNYPVFAAANTIGAAATDITAYFELPISYSRDDLRGAVFLNTTLTTSQLTLTLNPNFFATATGNAAQSGYKSSSAVLPKINSYTIEVYQFFYNNLPMANGYYILPNSSLATLYGITTVTPNGGFAAGSEYQIPYGNNRSFLSSIILYDNGGQLNAGTDITDISLQMANSNVRWRYPPEMMQIIYGRNRIGADWPLGCYYVDHRNDMIQTQQDGNTSLVIKPSLVNANAQFIVGWEYFSNTALLQTANSMGA